MSKKKQAAGFPEELTQKREYDPEASRLPMPPDPKNPTHSKSYNQKIRTDQEEQERKNKYMLALLLKYYDIPKSDPEKWKHLAICLATEYIPGFQMKQKPGAKKKWDMKRQIELIADVRIAQKRHLDMTCPVV